MVEIFTGSRAEEPSDLHASILTCSLGLICNIPGVVYPRVSPLIRTHTLFML